MFKIEITGLKQLQDQLKSFSDRRMQSAVAEALNTTANKIKADWSNQLRSGIDRPTATTRNAVIVKRADVGSLVAEVSIKDQTAGRTPAEYLRELEFGGNRTLKKFELALQAKGVMPRGYKAVPGKHAVLDAYGNVSRAQIISVLNQLGAALSPGYQKVISKNAAKRAKTAAKAGRVYVPVVQAVGKLEAGIYERKGKLLLPVFFFTPRTQYRAQLDLMRQGRAVAERSIEPAMTAAIAKRIASLRARG